MGIIIIINEWANDRQDLNVMGILIVADYVVYFTMINLFIVMELISINTGFMHKNGIR